MKTAISIPDAVFAAAEQLAQRQGVSRSELYVRAISKYIEEHQAEEVTEQLNRLYGDDPLAMEPELIALQTRSLPCEEW